MLNSVLNHTIFNQKNQLLALTFLLPLDKLSIKSAHLIGETRECIGQNDKNRHFELSDLYCHLLGSAAYFL
jgi:hypothetical protein